eukprot:2062805-Prymnesium_polylepis.1
MPPHPRDGRTLLGHLWAMLAAGVRRTLFWLVVATCSVDAGHTWTHRGETGHEYHRNVAKIRKEIF